MRVLAGRRSVPRRIGASIWPIAGFAAAGAAAIGGRAVAERGVLGPTPTRCREPAAAHRRGDLCRFHLIATDPAGTPVCARQLETAGHRVSEVDPTAFADGAAARAAASNETDVGDRVLIAEEGDDPTEQAARLSRDVAIAGGGSGAATDPAMDRHDRGAAGRAGRFPRWRTNNAGRRHCRGRGLGLWRGCCSTRRHVCRCGSSTSPRRWTGPSAGARSPRSWRPQPRRPKSSGPGRVAMCLRLRRGLPPRWAAPGQSLALDRRHRRAALTPCIGGRPPRVRPDREKFRSTCMPPGSISAT